MWAASRDAALAGKAMKTPKNAWQIIYSLLPERGFDYKPIASSSLATPEQLGQQLFKELAGRLPAAEYSKVCQKAIRTVDCGLI